MSPVARIRRARPEEAAALSALGAAAKASWGYDAAFMARYRARFDLSPGFVAAHPVFAAERADGSLVGFFALERQAGGALELLDLFVDPACFGRGIGGALLARALDEARSAGARRVHLLCDPNAEPFYRRHGAVRLGEQRSRAGTRMLPHLAFELTPAPAAAP